MISDVARAYMAGIVDGEGCIHLRMIAKLATTMHMFVMVANCEGGLIEWINERWPGRTELQSRSHIPNTRDCWHWSIGGDSAVALLEDVMPYLVIKRSQAELAIHAWTNRQPVSGWRSGVPLEIVERRRQWVQDMHALNARGPKQEVS